MLDCITLDQYNILVERAISLKRRGGKPYILLTPDKYIIKHIYNRSILSSARFSSHAKRFLKNAQHLSRMGFQVPDIYGCYYFPDKECHLIIYRYFEGHTVGEYGKKGNLGVIAKMLNLISEMHDRGIYFRDLHTDNMISNLMRKLP